MEVMNIEHFPRLSSNSCEKEKCQKFHLLFPGFVKSLEFWYFNVMFIA